MSGKVSVPKCHQGQPGIKKFVYTLVISVNYSMYRKYIVAYCMNSAYKYNAYPCV